MPTRQEKTTPSRQSLHGTHWSGCRSVLLTALLAFAGTGAFAQGDRGGAAGHVVDSTGAVAVGAGVAFTDEATHVTMRARTNGSGDFDLSNLNAGRYTVVVSVPGFQSYRLEHLQVDIGVRAEVNATLKIGDASSEVTVNAEAQQVDTNSANLGMTIEQKTITDLPLVYGNSFSLVYLTPGVTLSGVDPNQHVYDSGTSSVSVNGSALNSIDYKLDGAPDNRVRTTAFTPNTESIAQYRNGTANYDATQGHSSGGFVSVQTRSGTDRFHGSLFGYYQNPKINANYWLLNSSIAQSKPTFVREGFGVGGPILSRKLFFFYGYEHSRQGSPNNNTANVPTAAEKAGDFSALLGLGTGATCGASPAVLSGKVNPYQLFDPKSVVYDPVAKTYNRLCIPNNNVAKYTAINPIAEKVLSLYPDPNGGSSAVGFYSYATSQPDYYYGMIGRFDYTISPRQNAYAHLLRSRRLQHKDNYFPPVSGTDLRYENWGAAGGHSFVFNSSTVLNTTLGYTRFTNQNVNSGQGQITPATIGMPSYLVDNLPPSAQALPRFDLTGYTSLNTSGASSQQDDIYLVSSTLSRQQGSHFFRFGGETRRYLTNGTSAGAENGAYVTNGNLATQASGTSNSVGGAGFSVAEFEFGLLDSGSQAQNADYAGRSDWYGGFFHDDWRVSNRLTMNLGLRWEYETPLSERNNKQIVAFDPNAVNSTTAAAATAYAAKTAGTNALLPASLSSRGGVAFANTSGYGHDPYNSPKYEFAPRFGFAFAATPRTVLRGGFGIFFDSLQSFYLSGGNGGTLLMPQQGYSQTSTITGAVYANGTLTPGSTLDNPFPAGLTRVTGNAAGYNTALGSDIQFYQPNPHMPYNERFSFGVQRQFAGFVAAVDYVGNHGVHQPIAQLSVGTNYGGRQYNAIPQQYYSKVNFGADARAAYYLNGTGGTVVNPFYGLVPANSANNLSSANISVGQLLRPFPEYNRVNAFTFDGMSIYHSLQVQVQRRFSKGLSTTQAFTFSKTMDATVFLNDNDTAPWYGISNNDRPLRYAGSVIYQLPWGRGRRFLSNSRGVVAQVVGGWQVQAIYQIQSGQPLTFGQNDIYYGDNPGNSHWSRAQYKASQPLNNSTGGLWFNPANWLTAATGPGVKAVTCPTYSPTSPSAQAVCPLAFPNSVQVRTFALRYGNLRADHLNQADMGIQREFKPVEFGTLQFRAEAINLLNHPVYAAPTSTDPSNVNFGRIVSQGNQPRVFQFAGFFRF